MRSKVKKSTQPRGLPKSLQGIESILRYLKDSDKKTSSIKKISDSTNISMRVVKNILLQLEKFNQVERVTEKNNILPKWKITKFGKKVIKQAKGIEETAIILDNKIELLKDVEIPDNNPELKEGIKSSHETIVSKLNELQNELNKQLGPILNINDPRFEDLLSFIIKRLKYLRQKFTNLPSDPIASFLMRKKGEKEKKISKEEQNSLLAEIFFFNHLIINILTTIFRNKEKLSQFIEDRMFSNAFSSTYEIISELRILSSLFNYRESIKVNLHVFSKENLKKLSNNEIDSDLLDQIIEISISEEDKQDELKDIILRFHNQLIKGEKQFNNHVIEIKDNLPLYALYQLIYDEFPRFDFTIEQLEEAINQLADDGYVPGVKIIQEDEDHYLKVVQLKEHDMDIEEQSILSHAIKFESFTLADMIEASGLSKKKVYNILQNLTDLGILRYSKSFLHGERWYVSTAWNWNKEKYRIRENIVRFELEFRNFIKKNLKTHYKEDWWEIGIPEIIKNKVANRITNRQKSDPKIDVTKMSFLDFSDYSSIIFRKKNWSSVFANYFPNKKSIDYPLERLSIIRNDISHARVHPDDLNKYSVYVDEIKKYINQKI